MVGWVLLAATFLGVSIGLSLMQPIDDKDCVPLEQPGYGRSRTQQLIPRSSRGTRDLLLVGTTPRPQEKQGSGQPPGGRYPRP